MARIVKRRGRLPGGQLHFFHVYNDNDGSEISSSEYLKIIDELNEDPRVAGTAQHLNGPGLGGIQLEWPTALDQAALWSLVDVAIKLPADVYSFPSGKRWA